MTDDTYFKLPRLYSENSLVIQEDISLPKDQAHYLKNVMRRAQGDQVELACLGDHDRVDHILIVPASIRGARR